MLNRKYTAISEQRLKSFACTKQSAVALLKISFGNWDHVAQQNTLLPERRMALQQARAVRLNQFTAVEHPFHSSDEHAFRKASM